MLSLGHTSGTTADGDVQLVAGQARGCLVKTPTHARISHKMHTTACCFHTSTPRRTAGFSDVREGDCGGGGRDAGGCSGNLTQSCVPGMTSLGGPCRSPAAWELRRGLERGMEREREREGQE